MPTILADIPPVRPAPPSPPRKLWTRAECSALEAAGLLDGQHLELIEGDLINKMGKNLPHLVSLGVLMNRLKGMFGEWFVLQEASIDVAPEDNPTNEPEPDIIVLKREFTSLSAIPRPEDLHLVVEIADTTLRFDLTTKAALYARAGIVGYWVLDVTGRRLIVHRDPRNGVYSSIVEYREREEVSPLAAAHVALRVSDAFAA